MKFRLAVICGLLLASPFLLEGGGRSSSQAGDGKPPLIESGYVRKIDLKKKMLTVEGNISSLPEQLPGQRGGGRGAAPNANLIREFQVLVTAETVIQDEKKTLTFDQIKLNDYVMVIGIQKGKSANVTAASIAVSDR